MIARHRLLKSSVQFDYGHISMKLMRFIPYKPHHLALEAAERICDCGIEYHVQKQSGGLEVKAI
jgi:hypothetical protein